MLADNDQGSLPQIYRRRTKTISSYPEQNHTAHLKYSIPSSINKNSTNLHNHNRKSLNQVTKTIQVPSKNVNSQLQIYKEKHKVKPEGESLQIFIQSINKRTLELQPIQEDKAFSKIENHQIYRYYDQFIRGNQLNQQIITRFSAFLHIFHSLFQKNHLVLVASLLQIGNIQQYSQNHKIYKYNSPIKNVGFILWGKLTLKKYKSKQKYQCHPCDILGEQMLFESVAYSNSNDKFVEKGEILTKQTCRALSNCGILNISSQKFTIMEQQLKKHGFKEVIDRFKNIMQRNYLKKKQFRRIRAVIISQ